MTARRSSPRERTERGSTVPLIIGAGLVLLILVAVVVNSSAAFLRRSSLDTIAEGAALYAADHGAEGAEVYTGSVGSDRLRLTDRAAQAAAEQYLAEVGAHRRFPGIRVRAHLDPDGDRVEVRVSSRLTLPLGVPGVATETTVTGTGAASTVIDR